MAVFITGILTIQVAASFLDGRLLVIDGPRPPDPARRARDFFVNNGTPSGSQVTVCGDVDSNNVIHMFPDNSKCQGN